jgi:hypothetical protein
MRRKKEESNITFIRDPKIEPYFIGKDAHGYTVYHSITPDAKNTENNKQGKDYIKPMGHYSNFGNCLKAITQNKTNDKKSFDSIKEYIERFEQIQSDIKDLLNLGF